MTAREAEAEMLDRCATTARDSSSTVAQDQREANVFRVAAMVIQSRLPAESSRLMRASENYFSGRPNDLLPAAEVVRKGWIFSLPRLRDMLTFKIRHMAGRNA